MRCVSIFILLFISNATYYLPVPPFFFISCFSPFLSHLIYLCHDFITFRNHVLNFGVICINLTISSFVYTVSVGYKMLHLLQPSYGAVDKDVLERGLVKDRPKWKEVVDNHATYHTTPHRTVDHMTLAYVTPVSCVCLAFFTVFLLSHCSPFICRPLF